MSTIPSHTSRIRSWQRMVAAAGAVLALGLAGPLAVPAVDLVASAASRPAITSQPVSVTALSKTKITFSVRASGAKSYQWQSLAPKSSTWKNIAKATAAGYTLTTAPSLSGTAYRVRVTNASGSTYSAQAVLTVSGYDRVHPWKINSTFRSGDWRIALQKTDTNAWPEILAYDEYDLATPPRSGWSYITVPLSLRKYGKVEGLPWLDITADFVGRSGKVYTDWCENFGPWDDILDSEDYYPGATGVLTTCLTVPTSEISGGVWRVRADYDTAYNDVWTYVKLA